MKEGCMKDLIKNEWSDKETRYKYIMIAVFLFAILLPNLFSSYKMLLFCKVLLLALCAMSNIMMSGYGGMASFAHITFYGITAYAIAIGVVLNNKDFMLMALIGIGLSVLVSFIYAFVSVRAVGRYFFQISMAFLQIVYLTVITAAEMTRGMAGISGIPSPTIFGLVLQDRNTVYYFTLAVVFLCYLLFKMIVMSPFGVSLRGVRDNPQKMAAMGFNVKLQKFLAIVLSAFFCAIAGVLWVIIFKVIAPENVSTSWAIILMFIAMLGSTKRLEGAFLGGVIYVFADDWISGVTQRYKIIVGAAFILLVLFCPEGFMGINYKTIARNIKKGVLGLVKRLKGEKPQSHNTNSNFMQ